MKKAFKIIGKVFLGLLILIALFLVIMTVYNQIMLKKNKALYETPLGQLVEVDGHNMSIYTEGEGEHTIVFLSGHGTPSPILDFKPLFSRLSDDYKIVVVEKFGYGFSDIVDSTRDMETILRQDREALEKCGIEAPYVLCAHSFSGYEATRWAQEYPDEVEAIVGLDMCTPHCMDVNKLRENAAFNDFIPRLVKYERLFGIVRLFDYNESGTLTDREAAIYKEIACHKIMNDTMLNEGNTETIIALNDERNSAPLPTVPMILYVSNEPSNDAFWTGGMQAMADASSDGTLIQLECGHYVHDYEYERISKDMKALIEKLNR
ncbi:MAG: alpha/beta hydrolase [Oscillospiraceae bacterium]|nr:alpha/beta hydrolase [Oscillospiraceae bacterium]